MKRERGVALIEFALILPMLLMIIFITTELGRAIQQYNTLAKSVREAARFLSVRAPGTGMTQARNIILYGNPAGTGTIQVAGLSASHVPNPTWATIGSYPAFNTVTVTVQGYQFVPMVSSVFGMRLDTVTFSPIRATMRSPTT